MARVVLLRGVNVGGHRTFRPRVLAETLADLDVVNLGAAGTFVVRARASAAAVRSAFAEHLPFDTEIMVCDGSDFPQIARADAFAGQPEHSDLVRFVSVLSRAPRKGPDLPLSIPAQKDWVVRILAREGRYVFGTYRRHMKAVGQLGRLDALFGTAATTRNWNTIESIVKILERK